MSQIPASRHKPAGILLILFVSLVLNVVGIWYGLPSRIGWAPDEILPRDVQEGVVKRFSNDWFHKYPPLHCYLLAIVEAPLVVAARLRGQSLEDISVNSSLILANRFLSLLLAAGIVFLVYKCGREVFDQRSSLFASAIAALLVPLVYYAKTANLDVPYLVWFMASLNFFLRLLKTRRRKYYIFFALTSAMTICAKDQAYGLYVFPPLVILFSDWKSKKTADPKLALFRILTSRTYLFAMAVALGTFVIVSNLAFNLQGFLHHIKLITGPTSQSYKLVAHTLSGHLQLLGRAFSQVRFSLGWPLFLICVAGLILALAAKKKNFLLLSLLSFAVGYEIFYIHVILFNYSRYYLPLCLILSLFGGQFLSSTMEARFKLAKFAGVAVALVFLYSALYAFSLDLWMVKDSRYTAEKWMRQNISREATVGLAVWQVYAPRVEGYRWIPLTPVSLPKFQNLPSKPDFVIVNAEFSGRFPPESRQGQLFSEFYNGVEPYEVAFRYRTRLSWLPLKLREVLDQINTINPEILIYRKR